MCCQHVLGHQAAELKLLLQSLRFLHIGCDMLQIGQLAHVHCCCARRQEGIAECHAWC